MLKVTAARRRLSPNDEQDFAAEVRLKLIENGYDRIRQWRARASFETYITTLIQRFFIDLQRKKWGKWRPSALARQLGPEAEAFEALIGRSGRTVDEAIAEMFARDPSVDVERLRAHADAMRRPPRPREVPVEALDDAADGRASATSRIDASAYREFRDAVRAILRDGLAGLDEEDQLILRLHFDRALKISTISRTLGLEQRPLYRRVERGLRHLRRSLEEAGYSREQVLAHLLDLPGEEPEDGATDTSPFDTAGREEPDRENSGEVPSISDKGVEPTSGTDR